MHGYSVIIDNAMLTKPKPLLVVTDAATNVIISGKQNVIYVTDINRIFPGYT